MPKLTEQDRAIRYRWGTFLQPLVGDGPERVSILKLSAEVDKIAGRCGDNRAELYAYVGGKRTPRAERVFEVGEALRTCGVTWVSGPLALYAAGYVRAWVETTARVSPIRTENEVARTRAMLQAGRTVTLPKQETAVLLAVFVPLAALRELNLLWDLGDKAAAWRDEARSVLAEALKAFPTERLRSAFKGRAGGAGNLALIAEMARGAEPHFNANPIEPAVLSALREWAFLSAPPALQSKIATLQFQLQELRMERLQALAIAYSGIDALTTVDAIPETTTRPTRTRRKKA
ncbi:MAG: hypothetical protein ACYDD9_14175 [Acidithiobacillus sp.]